MSELKKKIDETLSVIRKYTTEEYPVGIILGTGLGGLVKEIEIKHEIDYADLPHFPLSTVESHRGKLIFGKVGGKNVVAMQGRLYDAADYISCKGYEIFRSSNSAGFECMRRDESRLQKRRYNDHERSYKYAWRQSVDWKERRGFRSAFS